MVRVRVCVDCQSTCYTFALTEVDAHALNCGHNVLNARVAEGRPLVGEGTLQCTFMACASAALWSCIQKILLKHTGRMMHTTCSYV